MINIKEGVNTKLIIDVTNEGKPYDGEVSFGIYNKKGEVIWNNEQEIKDGRLEVSLPKMKENDYQFTLETDDGYSDIKPLTVNKSIRNVETVKRRYQVDINNEWYTKDENKSLVNEFYMNNGIRLKKIESDTEENKKLTEEQRKQILEEMENQKKELLLKIDNFSKKVKENEGYIKNNFAFSEKRSDDIDDRIDGLNNDIIIVNEKINTTNDTITTTIQNIDKIEKNSTKTSQKLSKKIDDIKESIPTGGILEYEVNDDIVSEKGLWSSKAISERIKNSGNNKKYVSSQNVYASIEVAGQDTLEPTSPLDVLTIEGTGSTTITTNRLTNTITIDSSGGGGGGAGIGAPVAYNPTAGEVISGTATLTLVYNTTVGIVTVNGLVLNDTEYSQSGYTLTVTPVNGFDDTTDEILVFQYTVVVPINNIQNLTLQGFYVDTIVNEQITEAHRPDGTTVVNTYNGSNKLQTAVYTFPDTSTLTLTITYDIDGNLSTALYS